MIGPLLMILSALAPVGSDAPPVRLAPIVCGVVRDADVRAALRVELRGRLLDEGATPATDFVLVSVSCVGDELSLLAVRQGAGSPARRDVPLGHLAADARPRAVALSIAELLRVDLARNSPPPAEPPPPAPLPTRTVAIAAGFLVGGSVSGADRHWWSGYLLRVARESPTDPGSGRWGWGVAFQLENSDSPESRFDLLAGLSILARRPGGQFTPELGLGARIGPTWDYRVGVSPILAIIGGPFAVAAIEAKTYGRGFGRIGVEGGFDFGVRGGGWVSTILGGGFRF